MSLWNRLGSRCKELWQRRDREQDLECELQSHLELEAEEQEESGVPREEAGYAARRAFGNVTLVAEDLRATWWWSSLEPWARDLKYGARALRRSPGFTTVAALTLALGIGANTAIFSVVDALVLQPLPFPMPDQLVRIYSTKNGVPISGGGYVGGPSPLDVRDFAVSSHSFQKMVAYDTWRKNVSFGNSGSEPEQMRVGLVPAAYFEVLGIRPVLGRLFTDEENREDRRVAAISNRLWRTRYGSDSAILSRNIRINDEAYDIVAVMPDVIPDWMEGADVEVWSPFGFSDVWAESERGARGFASLARMKSGIALEEAEADLRTIAARLGTEHPADQEIGVTIQRLADTRVGAMRPLLWLLAGAVSLILLIACVNLANLLLARNSTRTRELAVRTALGAGRRALIRQLLAETLLLALAGGAIGLLLAKTGVASLARIHPTSLPQLRFAGIDWRVLIFTLLLSLVTSLLFGLAPAVTGTRLSSLEALKQGGRSGTTGRQSHRMRNLLVATEIAMSLMLLVGAGLLIQSIVRLQRQNLGIRPDHLLKGHFFVPSARYPDPSAITRFCDQFAGRVRGLPGVRAASVTTIYPPNNRWTQMLGIPGYPATRIQDVPSARFGVTDSHFLRTMGIPLLRGRDFSDSDSATSPPVALISQELVRRYFPEVDPIGTQIHIGPPPFLQITPGANITDSADVTVVGVIGDFKNSGLAAPAEPQILGLYAQHSLVNYGFKEIVIRTASEPHLLAPEIAHQLHQLDPNMPFAEVQTIDELVDDLTGEQRFTTVLLALFALAGLALAVVGVYGVISYLVAQRTREMAIRLAIGARPSSIFLLVLRQGMRITLIGAMVGLLGALAASRLMSGLLFEISPADPLTFAGGAVFLLMVALMASAIPGARAMRIHIVGALGQE